MLPAVVVLVLGAAAPAGVVAVVAAGASTVKSVPVTTVTWDRLHLCRVQGDDHGSRLEFATACAAPSWAGVLEA